MAKKSSAPRSDNDQGIPDAPAPLHLDEVLIALQKTFSRIGEASQKNQDSHDEKPTALIIGNVNFELAISLRPSERDRDALQVSDKPDVMSLLLKGTIDTDAKFKNNSAPPSSTISTLNDHG